MRNEEICAQRAVLIDWIDLVHGTGYGLPLSRQEFLKEAWRVIASIVQHNRSNTLIQETVLEHRDLIPRTFTLLTMLYGAYSSSPSLRTMLTDFVKMLGEDLVEIELGITAYAKMKGPGSYFPELEGILGKIRFIYGAKEFALNLLPPTPHQAYALFVLNHYDSCTPDITPERLFVLLTASQSELARIHLIASSS